MKFIKTLIVATAALAGAQAHAATFDIDFGAVPAGTYAAMPFTDGVMASVQTTSLANVYMQPQGVTGSYLVVSSQDTATEGSATINTEGASTYSFVWGSPDTFNSVDIYSSSTDFATYTGFDLQSDFGIQANGNNSNTGLFTITGVDGAVIDHLVLRSSGVAFEVAAPVPEPETYALMLAGLGALGFMARRRKAA